MRPLVALATVLLGSTFAFAGYPPPPPPGSECPTYYDHVEVGDVGVWSGGYEGQGIAALRVDVDRYSIIEDWLYVNHLGHFGGFSLWIYEESNGLAGLQRGDPVCVDGPAGVWADTIVNS